jgi:hypothetical protein
MACEKESVVQVQVRMPEISNDLTFPDGILA